MHRFYPDPALSRDDFEFLTADDSRHALTVLRLKAGTQVEVISGGQRWLAEIVGEENRIVQSASLYRAETSHHPVPGDP